MALGPEHKVLKRRKWLAKKYIRKYSSSLAMKWKIKGTTVFLKF